jgi:hypothetical protein
MSWPEPGKDRWEDPDDEPDRAVHLHWPLHWHELYPRERWIWFEQLWEEVCLLRSRYRLPIRSGWWENEIQLEALAALSAWVSRYDSGEWDDPPGKLALLYDLERVCLLLKDGAEPFHPDRDRSAFLRHLLELGCHPPTGEATPEGSHLNGYDGRANGYEPRWPNHRFDDAEESERP